ncbi:MAG: hypothetical protein HQL71_15745 [Magnetococcales bacterium]|nr:hypothetical protein [Magnetococcales bacterium]
MYKKNSSFLLSGLLLLILTGCSSVGPSMLQGNRISYNQAVQKANNEELLLNLVRLKYRDIPFFLEVGSISNQMQFTNGLGGAGSFQAYTDPSYDLASSFGYTEKPTVSYSPLQGDEFIRQMLTPISLDTLHLVAHSGWSMERLMRICVQRMNGLRNASSASGPTPSYTPKFEKFSLGTKIMRQLQKSDELDLSYVKFKGQPALAMILHDEGENSEQVRRLKETFNLNPEKNQFIFTMGSQASSPDFIQIQTRSLMGVLHLLSNAVEVPKPDQEAGKVTMTKGANNEKFDWNKVTGDFLHIKSQKSKPDDRSVIYVKYRNMWFYIDDSDLNSKSTLSMLSQLYYLQAGKSSRPAPIMTLSLD